MLREGSMWHFSRASYLRQFLEVSDTEASSEDAFFGVWSFLARFVSTRLAAIMEAYFAGAAAGTRFRAHKV